MAAPYTGSTSVGNEVDAVFQRDLLENARPLCPYFVGTKPAKISEHAGTYTARWRRFNKMSVAEAPAALAELTGNLSVPVRDSTQITVADQTATVLKYGAYILLTEEVSLRSFSEENSEYSELLGMHAGETLNKLQRNEAEDNSTLVYQGGVASTTAVNAILSTGTIANVQNLLQRASAKKFTAMTQGDVNIGTQPIRGAFWGICHVDVEYDIRQMTGFQAAETYASQAEIAMGEFGTVGGVRYISTEEAGIQANGGAAGGSDVRSTGGTLADVYTTVIFGQNAIGSVGFGMEHIKSIYMSGDNLPAVQVIAKARGSAGGLDPLDEYSTIGYKTWHVPKVLNSSWTYAVESASTNLAN